jgi:type I restriction enzyme S subunit
MTEVWPRISVGSLVQAREASLQTGPFGTQLSASEYVPEGIPVINVRNVGFGDVRADDLEYVSEGKAEQLHHHVLRVGDIVFGRKGAVERHALIGAAQDGWVQGSDCLRLRLQSPRFNVRFVSFYLRTKGHQDWMQALCSFGATMSSLNQDIVNRIELPCPPRAVQDQIAAALAAYDDLIANNQRRIALLESMAEEIYREWFVRMRFPGYRASSFDKGLPMGWNSTPLGQLIGETKRAVKKGDLAGHKRYVGLEHISRKSVALTMHGKPEAVESDKLAFVARDILFSKIRPYLHKVALAHFDGICSTDTLVLRPKRSDFREFALFTVFSETFIEIANTASKGTKMPRADWHFLKQLRIPVPSDALLARFSTMVKPMLDEIAMLIQANEKLATQRDALLPRLISGKLRVEALGIQFPPSMQPPPTEAAPRDEAMTR